MTFFCVRAATRPLTHFARLSTGRSSDERIDQLEARVETLMQECDALKRRLDLTKDRVADLQSDTRTISVVLKQILEVAFSYFGQYSKR
jgi:hypothetical protein